jgi:hypothetical protein
MVRAWTSPKLAEGGPGAPVLHADSIRAKAPTAMLHRRRARREKLLDAWRVTRFESLRGCSPIPVAQHGTRSVLRVADGLRLRCETSTDRHPCRCARYLCLRNHCHGTRGMWFELPPGRQGGHRRQRLGPGSTDGLAAVVALVHAQRSVGGHGRLSLHARRPACDDRLHHRLEPVLPAEPRGPSRHSLPGPAQAGPAGQYRRSPRPGMDVLRGVPPARHVVRPGLQYAVADGLGARARPRH